MSRNVLVLVFALVVKCLSGINDTGIDSLNKVLISGSAKNLSEIHNQLSGLYIDSSLELAKLHVDKALSLAETTIDKANAHYSSGELYYYLNDLEKSNQYYQKAFRLYSIEKDYSSIADCLSNLGINYEIRGDFEKALKYHLLSYDYYVKDNNKRGMAIALNNIGIIYNTKGQYEKGYIYYQKSLKIEEELGNKEGIATSLSNIGLIHKKMGQYDKTIAYYKQSLAINEEIENYRSIALTSSNLGSVYNDLELPDSAEYYYQKSLDIYFRYDDFEGIGLAYHNLGSMSFNKGNYDLALEYYKKGLEYREKVDYKRGISVTLNNIGETYLKMNKPSIATHFIEKSYEIAADLELKEQLAANYLTFSNLYIAKKDYEKALDYFKKHKSQEDSLLNETKHKQINELQTKYETEKKEQMIKLQQADIEAKEAKIQKEKIQKKALFAIGGLIIIMAIFIYNRYRYKNKMNVVLKTTNYQLEALNATKNKFFSIISHDLKNPFGTLVSVSDMLKENYNELEEGEKQHIINTISRSAGMTQDLLENLLQWAMTQTGKIQYEPTTISIKSITEKVVSLLAPHAEKKNITTNIKIGTTENAFADRNAIETVIRNLYSNALKFTNKNGIIHITIDRKGSSIITNIKDSGIGIENPDLEKLFRIDMDHRKIGKSREKGTGLGLILCKEFVEINKGKIWVESELNKGSIFSFSLPLYKA